MGYESIGKDVCVKMKKKKSTAADVRPRQTEGEKWAELARRVRKRRIIYAAALILIAAAVTVCVGNYRCAGVQVRPPVAIDGSGTDNGQIITQVYYSLGFKQVVYQSEYGRNYSERKWLWEEVEQNPEVLTANQYQQLMEQLGKKYRLTPVYEENFDTFHTFEASILDVKKDKNLYTVYMAGQPYAFFEYDGLIYWNCDGDPEALRNMGDSMIPLVVTARWDGQAMSVEEVREYGRGDSGSAAIFENFPKAAATRLLTDVEGREDLHEVADLRAKLKAASHFGKPLAQDTYLSFDEETKRVEVYRIVPDKGDADSAQLPQDNDERIKQEILKGGQK